jgi:hypothetical protein
MSVSLAKALAHLVSLGVLDEITGRPRNKVFVYPKYPRSPLVLLSRTILCVGLFVPLAA